MRDLKHYLTVTCEIADVGESFRGSVNVGTALVVPKARVVQADLLRVLQGTTKGGNINPMDGMPHDRVNIAQWLDDPALAERFMGLASLAGIGRLSDYSDPAPINRRALLTGEVPRTKKLFTAKHEYIM